jgi:superfamily II DNA/RNA helicase
MAALPKQRRTYLFSATLQDINSEEGKVFGLRNAMKVVVRAKTA